ncbi:hypothetical protein DM02DRAFT_733272 [Periconia macrospinosa]|uniref:FHA domain-containing protein n=1 Tax=Periconia macrospinosa TaxID=97972 RepID=A0A2V1D591_9PLEO|nr:hypothetical protein DM02DRAFT_733272 [Periconia macrospinosa]
MPADRTFHHPSSTFVASFANLPMPMAPALRVTLRSFDAHDSLERQLSLFPNKPFTIGRASTNSMKPNLMTAADNAYIDSPVISRDHAFLTLRLCPPSVQITDSASMHGTMVNGVKLKPHRPRKLNDGDLLQFGADVTRNERTLYPPHLSLHCEANTVASEYFVARKYTYHAPPLDTLTLEPSSPQPADSYDFTVPEAKSDDDDSEADEEESMSDSSSSSSANENEPRLPLPPRSRLGSQANPVTIDDTEDGTAELSPQDNERDLVPTLPQAQRDELDSFDDGGSVDAQYHGSPYSSDIRDAEGFLSSHASDSELDNGSDEDARTDFDVEEEEDYEEERDDLDSLGDDDEDSENIDPACGSQGPAVFQAVNEHVAPVITTDTAARATTPPLAAKMFVPNLEPRSVHAASKAPEPENSPSNTYKMGPFAASQGNYAFGCVDSTLPYGGESSRTRPSGLSEYLSPYMPREHIPFEASAYDLPPTNPYLSQPEQRYTFDPYTAPTFSFAPSIPACTYPNPPPVVKPSPSPEPAWASGSGPTGPAGAANLADPASPAGPAGPVLAAHNTPEVDSSPQPVRRTKVPISEIVEDAPPQQPPTPTSLSGTLKRKADEMEQEVSETPADSSSVPSTDVVAKESSEITPVLNVSTQERPKKRLRAALGNAAMMAAYLIPSTAIAVGMLTQLPDAFFQG